MAKEKRGSIRKKDSKIELGKVVKVHKSGIAETDKGHGITYKDVEKGDVFQKIGKKVVKVESVVNENKAIDKADYEELDQKQLMESYTLKELGTICKQERITPFSALNEEQRAVEIAQKLGTFVDYANGDGDNE